MMLHVAKEAVEAARAAGAHYADARFVHEDSESITVRNQEMEGIARATSEGVGVRVLVDGYWGFAATARPEGAEIARTAGLAVEIARAAARLPREPVKLTEVEPATGTWASPFQDDPFNVSLEEKVALLMEATRRMQEVHGLAFAEGGIDLYRVRTSFASSEGSAIEQTVLHSGAGLDATAISEGELQRRSYPNSFRGHIAAAGWEHIAKLGLIEEAERTATEAVELLSAPDCPSEVTTLVLDSGQMELQVHESIGHAVELDRVLGMEESYAGSSFVSPGDRGNLRYASDLVSITADATIPGGLGSFGWDDEGAPAQRVPIIVDGTFQDFISSRETAGAIGGRSTGAMRADGWGNLPLIRMTNINIEPREGSLADIIGDTKDGIFMATNQSWSIDDKRVNFQFGCEIAWRIKGGKLTQMFRNPNYTGITTEFWRSCDAVGGREDWTLWGTPNCGKGQPVQTARVGHGTAPARFRNVQVGVR
ncbi:MAG TPA: TldD/PmbA family protein [Actinomycetota bacterium]|jgi:TldD protein|nr:TldD/PmbA family protein [Actinomycetota bacterium]